MYVMANIFVVSTLLVSVLFLWKYIKQAPSGVALTETYHRTD